MRADRVQREIAKLETQNRNYQAKVRSLRSQADRAKDDASRRRLEGQIRHILVVTIHNNDVQLARLKGQV